jgi:oligoendopeptidase F
LSTLITLPARSEIADKYKWNDTSVFPDQAAWQVEYQALRADLDQLDVYRGRLHENASTLADALDVAQALQKRAWIAIVYAGMQHSVDTLDQNAAALNGQANSLMGQIGAAFAFLEPEILAIGQATLATWLEQEPRLAGARQYIDNLFRKQKHIRSAEVEQLLGLLADPFTGAGQSYGMLTSADMRFQPATASDGTPRQVSQGTIYTLMDSPDRATRQTAWENYRDEYLRFKNTLAAQLETSIKQNVFTMRARRFENTLTMALDEQNLPPRIFHNLIAAFKKNLPTWQRYWRLRKKALGVASLHTYDIWTPLSSQSRAIPYQEAVDWICAGLEPMGKDYVDVVRRACLQERWVDVMPNQGKREGAFSSGAPGTHPFIVMSYDNNIGALSTLAHELGHSMHSYLTWQNQPMMYSNYGMFAAEVASNFHQALVRAHMLREITDRAFRLNLLEEALQNYHRYFFIMPTLARLELIAHERVERGEALTADTLNELCADLFAEGYGDDLQIDRARDGVTWATFGHLYVDYYVFQYATGISAANALSQRILNGAPHAVEDYLGFLRAGSSEYPLDALRGAGVDMSQPEPVDTAFQVLAEYVNQLEELVG